jgi:hypothetical protein
LICWVLWEPELDIVIDSLVFCWEPWLCISMNLFDFWEPLVKCCTVHSWFFPSQMLLCSCFVSQCFCQSFLCQCSSAIYGFTTKSSSPIMIPIACLLASFLPSSFTHSGASYFSLLSWVSGRWNPSIMRAWSPWLQHWWGAPQECSIMWHSLVCPPRPHHSFLTWVVLSSRFCFFSPKKVRRNQREWIGLPPNSKL